MLSLVTVKSAVGLGNGVLAVFPMLATVVFAVGSIGTGLLFAARGLGALIGPLLLPARPGATDPGCCPGWRSRWSSTAWRTSGVAASPWFWLALVLVTFAHMAGGGNWVMSNYALQIEVPDALRGRVFATDMMIATLAISVSLLCRRRARRSRRPARAGRHLRRLTLLYGIGWRLATRRLMRRRCPRRQTSLRQPSERSMPRLERSPIVDASVIS